MNDYKVTLMRLGHVTVQAESEEEAGRKAASLPETAIHWLSGRSGEAAPYLVALAELADSGKIKE